MWAGFKLKIILTFYVQPGHQQQLALSIIRDNNSVDDHHVEGAMVYTAAVGYWGPTLFLCTQATSFSYCIA